MNEALSKLHHLWKDTFYINCLLILIPFTLFLNTRKAKGIAAIHNRFRFFLFSVFSLFLFTPAAFIFLAKWTCTIKYNEVANLWYSCIEVFVFYSYFENLFDFPDTKKQLLRYCKYIIISSLLLISIFTLSRDCVYTNRNSMKQLWKLGEIVDVFKSYFLVIPCLMYFVNIYKENKILIYKDTLLIYSYFTYSIFGIIVNSLSINLRSFRILDNILNSLPSLALLFVCISIYYYLSHSEKTSVAKKVELNELDEYTPQV
jgi:hypothetical protein